MTPSELQAIEARTNAATPGPWSTVDYDPCWVIAHDAEGNPAVVAPQCPCEQAGSDEADKEFIAHARTDVPALIAEVRRLEACLARVNAAMERVEFDLYARINALEAENERLQAAAASVGDDLSVHPTSAYARKARELK